LGKWSRDRVRATEFPAKIQGENVRKIFAIFPAVGVAFLAVLIATLAHGGWQGGVAAAAREGAAKNDAESAPTVHAEMRNVMYHFDDKVVAHIRVLSGELTPTSGKDMPVFDDKNSFDLRISSAEIAMNTESLTNAFNTYVFASPKAPLKDVKMTIENGKLKVKGKLHDKGDLPFETDGVLTPTPDGRLRMQADKIRALHLPVKGLMDLIGADLAAFIKTEKVPGLSADGDGLVFDLKEMLPPPHIDGSVTALRLEGQNMILTFGTGAKTKGARGANGNFMSYRGNRLRFGKLTMSDADLTLLDMNANDPLDFNLDHYLQQVEAGYTKINGSFGLRVYIKDFDKLSKGPAEDKRAGY
jgi:hypothetical protein